MVPVFNLYVFKHKTSISLFSAKIQNAVLVAIAISIAKVESSIYQNLLNAVLAAIAVLVAKVKRSIYQDLVKSIRTRIVNNCAVKCHTQSQNALNYDASWSSSVRRKDKDNDT